MSQLQGYDCDPEVTLTDDGIIISVTLTGDLTPSLIRDKLVFNYFIKSVSSGDTVRRIKKLVLPQASQFKNVSPFVNSTTLDEHVTSDLGAASEGPRRSYTIDDEDYILSFRRVADPRGNMLPGVFMGEPTDEDISTNATQINAEDLQGGRNMTKLISGSKLGAGGGDANGPGLGMYSPPHQRIDTTESTPAAPEGVGVSSDSSQAAIPFNSMVSGDHDDYILNPRGLKNNYDSLGLAAFKRVSSDEIERTTQMDMASGGGKPALGLGEEVIEPWFSQASKNNIYLGLAHEHPYDEETDEYYDV